MGSTVKYILLTPKTWHTTLFKELSAQKPEEWLHIVRKEDFTVEKLREVKPQYVFIPHWSYIIPKEIFENYTCIVFHMTDLPYGRGGSPLQNLIVRGFVETKISAIKVEEGLDTGPVYLKRDVGLHGTAEEIFIRMAKIIREMIERIIDEELHPVAQHGAEEVFKRRKPEDSNIAHLETLEQLYDYIRMLDCEGYPNAFAEIGNFRLEFTRASIKGDESIIADVRITKK
jgi:methionyl-tRNA formyltransferase